MALQEPPELVFRPRRLRLRLVVILSIAVLVTLIVWIIAVNVAYVNERKICTRVDQLQTYERGTLFIYQAYTDYQGSALAPKDALIKGMMDGRNGEHGIVFEQLDGQGAVEYRFAQSSEHIAMGFFLTLDRNLNVIPDKSMKCRRWRRVFGIWAQIEDRELDIRLNAQGPDNPSEVWPKWIKAFVIVPEPNHSAGEDLPGLDPV